MASRAMRLAGGLYRRFLPLVAHAIPEASGASAVAVFEALQHDGWVRGGWSGLARVWRREFVDLVRLRWFGAPSHVSLRGALPMSESAGAFAFFGHDVRDAVRALRRSPGYTAVVILTLALGIGVNTAIFGIVDALLFKALPYTDPDRLVYVFEKHPAGGRNTVAPANFLDWRARAGAFSDLEATMSAAATMLDGGAPENLVGARVTPGYFRLLGLQPLVGRTFQADEGAPGAACVTIMSHRLWARRFGSDAGLVGRPMRFAGMTCTLVGVLPPDSVFDRSAAEIYWPVSFGPDATRTSHFLTVMARLRPGVAVEAADAEMSALAASIAAEHPEVVLRWGATVAPLRDVIVRVDARRLVWVLFGAVGVVLIVACVNVAGLVLSRTTARRREVAIRAALGAGRWRVFRGLLVESVLLSSAGAALGLMAGSWTLRAFSAFAPAGTLPPEAFARLDGRTLAFTASLAILTGLLFGTWPAWQGARTGDADALKAGGRSLGGSRVIARIHSGLLVIEVALATVLVTGATLLVASFLRLTSVSPGVSPDGVYTLSIAAPSTRYGTDAEVARFYRDVVEAMRHVPGVASASAITSLPLGGWLYGTTFAVEGEAYDPLHPPAAHIQSMVGDYFQTLGIPLAAGRTFADQDDADHPFVAIVNETFVRRFLPGAAPVGRRMRLDINGPVVTVVGVIDNVKTYGLGDAAMATPEIYMPHAQQPISPMFVALKVTGETPAAFVPSLRSAMASVDPEVALGAVVSMGDRIGQSVTTERFRTALVSAFAALALLLACLGIYAVRSQAVLSRLREVGIRVALGATRGQVLALVLGQGARLVSIGLILGVGASLVAARAINQWLFATTIDDPAILGGAMLLLGGAALVASWVPARRAAATDPLITLGQE